MKANIHYNVPPDYDKIPLRIIFSFVDDNGEHLVTLNKSNVTLTGLENGSEGIKTIWPVIEFESFKEHFKWYGGRNENKNNIKVEIENVPGFTILSEFQRNETNDEVTSRVYPVNAYGSDKDVHYKPEKPVGELWYVIVIIVILLIIQIYRWKERKSERFSGLLAIIIMLILVTASNYGLWIWFTADEGIPRESTIYKDIEGDFTERTPNNDFIFFISGVIYDYPASEGYYYPAGEVKFEIHDTGMNDLSNGHYSTVDVYGKPINDKYFVSFRDRDLDGDLTIGDIFIIKSIDHVNDDGTFSPGLVKEGDIFRIHCGYITVMEVTIQNVTINDS